MLLLAPQTKKIGSKENSILEFYQQFACVGGDPVFSESLCKELQKKFFQQRCELGRIGRRNMNHSSCINRSGIRCSYITSSCFYDLNLYLLSSE